MNLSLLDLQTNLITNTVFHNPDLLFFNNQPLSRLIESYVIDETFPDFFKIISIEFLSDVLFYVFLNDQSTTDSARILEFLGRSAVLDGKNLFRLPKVGRRADIFFVPVDLFHFLSFDFMGTERFFCNKDDLTDQCLLADDNEDVFCDSTGNCLFVNSMIVQNMSSLSLKECFPSERFYLNQTRLSYFSSLEAVQRYEMTCFGFKPRDLYSLNSSAVSSPLFVSFTIDFSRKKNDDDHIALREYLKTTLLINHFPTKDGDVVFNKSFTVVAALLGYGWFLKICTRFPVSKKKIG